MEKTIIAIENKINELTQDKVELFRQNVLADLNTKYVSLKLDSDKRESVLLNSVNLFDQKVAHIHKSIDTNFQSIAMFEGKLEKYTSYL